MTTHRVMVVEADGELARAMRDALHTFGFDVVCTAATTAAAVREATESRPDVTVVDAAVDDVDGHLETIEYGLDIPLVFAAGIGQPASLARTARMATHGCVSIPFRGADLAAAVELALDRHRAGRRAQRARARMLRELTDLRQQHRAEMRDHITNALHAVAGMLALQADQAGDARSAGVLRPWQGRLAAMALVYRYLRAAEPPEVDFAEYLRGLAALVSPCGRDAARRGIAVAADDLAIAADRAVCLGLVARELLAGVVNAPGGAAPDARLELRRLGPDAASLSLVCAVEPAIDDLGRALVRGVSEDALGGQVVAVSAAGAPIKVRFPRAAAE